MMRGLGHDLRYAVRQVRRHPGFALLAALTLALGIAATTTVFSFVDAAVLRPLPFPVALLVAAVALAPARPYRPDDRAPLRVIASFNRQGYP